ncbi:uncharacterized protein ARMOST_15183 [Armillaria ostoyae]|uniref:Uncharacterized protein n=1 Tax=Armillaria ostoyae TaxID=47428 RepID=A0A284RSN6_ARMOS|nr:uncharacterized protein ARMOST_15183 [Armillaria ostoyae]
MTLVESCTLYKHTEFTTDGYPNLACPNNGHEYVKMNSQICTVYINCDIVPYNPYFSVCYNCHINVEVCITVKAIKYIHKYIYKGHDRTTLEVWDHDEIKEFLDACYISAIESCWRMFSFWLHQEEPNVVCLHVHLSDEQLITYDENASPEELLLTAVAGAQSFQHLCTVNNVECATFKEACIAMGAQLQSLFVTLLLFFQPAKLDELWEEFKKNICDDLAHKLCQHDVPNPTDAQLYDFGLHLINKLLQSHGRCLSEWTQMPASTIDWAAYEDNPLLAAQLAYDIPSLQQLVINNLQTFNAEQKNAFDIIIDSTTHEQGKSVFLQVLKVVGRLLCVILLLLLFVPKDRLY